MGLLTFHEGPNYLVRGTLLLEDGCNPMTTSVVREQLRTARILNVDISLIAYNLAAYDPLSTSSNLPFPIPRRHSI